jgi:hypothetical protein
MRLTFFAGILLTAIMAGIGWRVWGDRAAVAVAVFGLLATGIQVGALALMRPVRRVESRAALPKFMARWGAGMGLRFLGVVALAIAAAVDRTHFPALPAALGFLGVLLPLLALEVRLIR